MKNITVIIIDDYKDYRWILKTFLSRNGMSAIDYGCRTTFIEQNHLEEVPDIAVISFDSKIELTTGCIEIFKKKYPTVKILINSIYDDNLNNKRIIQETVDGIVPKIHKDPQQIIKALKALFKNEKFILAQ